MLPLFGISGGEHVSVCQVHHIGDPCICTYNGAHTILCSMRSNTLVSCGGAVVVDGPHYHHSDSQLRRDHTNNSLPAATDLRNRTAQSTPIRQPNTTVHHAPVMVTTASENVKTSIDQQRRSAVLAQPQAGRPHRPPTAMCIPDVTVGSTWSLWPFNFLPFPFSAPPQRFTMVIAYAM